MNSFTLGLVVVIYLLVIAYLGYRGYSQTKSAKDYLLAGRDIHPFVMAMSYGATFISTSAIIGFGGIAGVYGMGLIWLTALNIIIGVFIAFIFFGRVTRKMGHNLDAHTFPEFLGNRFQSKKIQIISGAVIFVSMPLYAAVIDWRCTVYRKYFRNRFLAGFNFFLHYYCCLCNCRWFKRCNVHRCTTG